MRVTSRRCRAIGLAMFAALLLWDSGASAQQPVRPRTPPVSPYLNLARRDVNPAINYYGLIRPQLEFRSSIQQLQGQVNTIGQQEAAGPAFVTDLPPTGQLAGFNTHTRYFNNVPQGPSAQTLRQPGQSPRGQSRTSTAGRRTGGR